MDHFHDSTIGDEDENDFFGGKDQKLFGMCKIHSKEVLSLRRKTVWADFLVFVKSRPNADILMSESVEQSNPGIDLSVEKYLRFVET